MSNTLNLGTDGNWAVKKDSLLGYNSENGNFKPLPFSFSRASSATVVNKDGLIEIVGSGGPRIDFLNDSNGALLLEPQRSNLVTYSEDFANSSVWGVVNTTFTDNETQSPSGILTGKLTRNVTTFSCIRDATVSTVLGTTYVFSAFYKKDTETTINHGVLNESTGYVTFNFDTETISITRNDNSDTISNDGFGFEKYANGWYRVYLKFVRKAGSFQAQVARKDSGVIGQSTFIYGAQLEAGSYATYYIPTQGAISTRVAESCEQTPPSGIIGQTEGTIFVETSKWVESNNGRFFSISDGTTSNYIIIIQNTTFSNYAVYIVLGGLTQASYTSTVTIADNSKIAVGYKANDVVIYVNGVQVHTDTVSVAIPACNKVYVSSRENGTATFQSANGVRQALLYNTRLSNTELQQLTTL